MENITGIVEERLVNGRPSLELEQINVECELLDVVDSNLHRVSVCLAAKFRKAGDDDPSSWYSIYTQVDTVGTRLMVWTQETWEPFIEKHLELLQDRLEELDTGYPMAVDRQVGYPIINRAVWEAPKV